jgi:excisionase family DNA binding protein
MEVIVTSRDEIMSIIQECLKEYFGDQRISNNQPIIPNKLFNTKEILKFLDITEPTLIRWKKKGKIPYIEMGGIIRFDPAAVTKALEKNKLK